MFFYFRKLSSWKLLLQLDKKLSKSMEFRELTKRDAEISLEHYLEKLKKSFLLPDELSSRWKFLICASQKGATLG